MQIDNSNIRNFISFIYFNKYQTKPTDEILNSWSGMSQDEIDLHLGNLYENWGKNEQDLANDFYAFEQAYAQHIATPQAPPQVTYTEQAVKPQPKVATPQTSTSVTPDKKSKAGLWFIILPVMLVGGYIGYKYLQYTKMNTLFVITDNVAVRNDQGKMVGRMDIFPTNKTWSALRSVDNNIYEIPVDGQISESRKLILDDGTFMDYLTNNAEKMVYVSKNFLTDNREYIELNTTIFKLINNVKSENESLKSAMRKVIVGSISLEPSLKDKYIVNTCNNTKKEFTSIIKVVQNDKISYSLVAKMSDGNYYKFTGNPDAGIYQRPQLLKVQHPTEEGFIDLHGADLLFKTIDGNTYLYDCDGVQLDFRMIKDNKGDISHFQSVLLPY